jgi:hypothetical protein
MANAVTRFVSDVLERAGKTAAQAALLELGGENAGHLNALAVHWQPVVGFAAGGAILSILFSLASQKVGNQDTASLVKSPAVSIAATVAPVVPAEIPPNPDVPDAADVAGVAPAIVAPAP